MDRTLFLKDVEATRKLGTRVAEVLAPPLLVALTGPLGAGKTEFVRGMARGLAIQGIRSPSFVVLMIHRGARMGQPVRLYHLDLYRLEEPEELALLGLQEALSDPAGYVVVEWADRAPELLRRADLRIAFERVEPTGRWVRLEGTASMLHNLLHEGAFHES